MKHLDHDPTTAQQIHAARTYRDLPPDHYQTEWRSVADLIVARAASESDREFLAYFNEQSGETVRWSYAELIGRAAQIANLLTSKYGVQHGERTITPTPSQYTWRVG